MKDHSNFFLKEWTTSPKKAPGASGPATFRQYSTFHDQKYVSIGDFDSRKKRDIWTQTSQNIRRKRSSDRFLFQKCLSQTSIQSGVWGLCDTFQKCLTLSWCCGWGANFSCVLWRGLTYSGCLAPSVVNWDGDAAKGWVAHLSSGRNIWDWWVNLLGFGYFCLKRKSAYSTMFLTFGWLKLCEKADYNYVKNLLAQTCIFWQDLFTEFL